MTQELIVLINEMSIWDSVALIASGLLLVILSIREWVIYIKQGKPNFITVTLDELATGSKFMRRHRKKGTMATCKGIPAEYEKLPNDSVLCLVCKAVLANSFVTDSEDYEAVIAKND